MSTPSLRETIREDGLRVITKLMPHTKRFRLALVAGVGAAYDPPSHRGVFHFLEHVSFAGTTGLSNEDINNLLERYCREKQHNAETGDTCTIYWGEAVYRHFREICDLFIDIYFNPIFPEKRIESEKEVVLSELARYKDTSIYKADLALREILWKKNPQRREILGTKESIKSITRELLLNLHRRWYIPSNTVIIGIGKINHEHLVRRVFAALPVNRRTVCHREWPHEAEENPHRKEMIIESIDRKTAAIKIGCKIPPFGDRERDMVDILNDMLNWTLYQEVREEFGGTYSVESSFDSGDHQLGYCFNASTEVLPQHIEKVKELMWKIICQRPLEKDRFELERDSGIDDWLVEMESLGSWQEVIVERVIKERKDLSFLYKFSQKHRSSLSGIKFREVVEMRKKFLSEDRLVCVIVKPK